MSAIGKKKQEKATQVKQQTSEEILQRRRVLEGRMTETQSPRDTDERQKPEPTGIAAEKAVGALCYLPKSIHRLATRYADDHDVTAKRFFLETMLIGLEQQGVITHEQHLEALTLPNEYGWKGRGSKKPKTLLQ